MRGKRERGKRKKRLGFVFAFSQFSDESDAAVGASEPDKSEATGSRVDLKLRSVT